MTTKAEIYQGSCLCRGVRFSISTPLKFMAHDHCTICRRAHGAPFVTWCGVMESQFQLVRGEELLTRYKSSAEAERQFCKICGSHLFFRSSRWPGEVHVTRASIPDEMAEKPQAHVFFSDKAPWVEIGDNLPRFGGKTGIQPLGK